MSFTALEFHGNESGLFYVKDDFGTEVVPVPFVDTTVTIGYHSASAGAQTIASPEQWVRWLPAGGYVTVAFAEDVPVRTLWVVTNQAGDDPAVIPVWASANSMQIWKQGSPSVPTETGGNMNFEGNVTFLTASDAAWQTINCGHTNQKGSLSVNIHAGSSITTDTGTSNLGTGNSDAVDLLLGDSGDGYTGALLNQGTLTIQGSVDLDIGSGFPTGNGSLTISTGATLILEGSTSLDIAGTLTISTGVHTINNASIDVYNGSMLPYFTNSPTGLSVLFTDETFADGSGGAVSAWSWDFGDSSSSSLQNPTHTYASSGTYGVVLTVTDADSNTATCSISVTVS